VECKGFVVALITVRHFILSWAIIQPRKEDTRMMGMRVFGASRFPVTWFTFHSSLPLYSRLRKFMRTEKQDPWFQASGAKCMPSHEKCVAYSVNSIPTFSGQTLSPIFKGQEITNQNIKIYIYFNFWPLKIGPIGCLEMSLKNYRYTLCNFAEKRVSQNVWG